MFRLRAIAGAALFVLGAIALSVGLAGSPAQAAAGPTVVAPVGGHPAIPVHDDQGRWFWRITISDTTPYVASWEKRGGVFASPDEAISAVTENGTCRAQVVRAYFASFPSRAAFDAEVGTTKAGVWQSADLERKIATECNAASPWTDNATPGFRDSSGNWVVEVPYSLIGEGSHALFLVGVDYAGSYNQPACSYHWPDKSWAGYDCIPTIGQVQNFTVVVPPPPSKQPVLQGPVVDPGSFFAQTVFSGLKPLDLKAIAAALPAAGGAAMVLGALVAFPSMLLSSAVSKMHARVSRRRGFRWLNAEISGSWAILFLFVAAIVGGFSDPSFGFTWTSLRMLITVFLTFMVMNFGSTWLAWWFTRKHNGQEFPEATAKPFFLLILAGTVVFARVTNIDPAMVFGSVLALELGSRISKATEAVVTLIMVTYFFVIGIGAWLAYTWLASIHLFGTGVAGLEYAPVSNAQAWLGFGQVTIGEFMSILTVEAFSTIPLALVPLAGLEGQTLFQWKKWVWAVAYVFGMAAYIVVILPSPNSWTQPQSSFQAWVAVVVIYSLVAIAAYGLVTWRNNRDANHALLSHGGDEHAVAGVDTTDSEASSALGTR
jgi:hypothetical protein